MTAFARLIAYDPAWLALAAVIAVGLLCLVALAALTPRSEREDESWEDEFADGRCCALRDDHDGCCAYRCSDCDGWGKCPNCGGQDDLGCDWCEGDLVCPECGGDGWFNEFGDACMAPLADELPRVTQ